MPSFDLVVLGDVNPDLVLSGDVEPAFGQAERLADDARLTVGGSGAIVACGAARLGLRVALCGVVGDDLFGRWIREEIGGRGVDVTGLVTGPTLPTGLSVVLSTSNDRAILTFPGTIPTLGVDSVDRDLLAEARHVHVSSYFLQRTLTLDLPPLLDKAHAGGATTSIDPNWDPDESWNGGLRLALSHTDVFLPNREEAVRIAGSPDVDDAALELARTAKLVVVKLGAEGATAYEGTTRIRAPASPAPEVVDTTGAGDSFDAGFLASWLAGDPLERSLALGNACGALSSRKLGGVDGQPTMPEVLASMGGPPTVPG